MKNSVNDASNEQQMRKWISVVYRKLTNQQIYKESIQILLNEKEVT